MRALHWNALIPVGLMCLLGAALSVATITQYSAIAPSVCAENGGDCDALRNNRWAVFPPARSDAETLSATGIPVSAWGLGYFTFLAAWLILAGSPSRSSRYWHWLPVTIALGGGGLSVVLLGVMWRSGDWCSLCVMVHALNLTILASVLGAWSQLRPETEDEDLPEIPRLRLAISTLCLGVFAVVAGSLYSQQLRANAERQVLADRLEKLHQDTNVIGWLYGRQTEQSIPVRDDDLSLGNSDAEDVATLVVFSDAHCQSCREMKQRLNSEIAPLFAEKLQVVFKHFPLCSDCNTGSANVHPQSCQAAYLTEAARMQGGSKKGMEFWDLLAPPRAEPFSEAEITALADQAGLDAAQLLRDVSSSEVRERVAADATLGRSLGVRAIPALFLNGRELTQDLWESSAFWQLAARGDLSQHYQFVAPVKGGDTATQMARNSPRKNHDHAMPPVQSIVGAKIDPPTTGGATPTPAADLTKEQIAVRAAADGIIEQHDTDESGQLESIEWPAMTFNPQPYDLDNNGSVTREELVASIASVSSGASKTDNPEGKPSTPQPKLSTIELGDELEFEGPTLSGGTFDLSDYRGKVVVIDFWASWCPFCVEETPYLQRLYQLYHDQGLEIVGISSDNTSADLQKFVDDNKLPWPQIYFDEDGQRGRDNPLNQQYLLRGLPQIYVVDREGKVIAQVPRRHQVEEVVAKALGTTPSPRENAESEVQQFAQQLVRPDKDAEPDQRTAKVGEILDIQGTTLDGAEFNIADWRGKPVLVAFWASWCPHCKKELPNLQAAYERHHADGLEIVGVNLDRQLEDATKYLEGNPQPWPNLYRDEDGYRGFDHPLSWRYGISGVPAVYLVNGEGKVVSLKARGANLEIEVAQLLGKKPATFNPTTPQPVKPLPTETAQANPKPSGAKPLPSTNPFDYSDEELAGNILERFDTNRDGTLQAEEWAAMPNGAQGMDRDGNGLLTKQELQESIRAAKTRTAPSEVVTAKIDLSQVPATDIATQILTQYDKNGNGRLEAEEWSKLPGKPEVFDTNSDAVITLEELTSAITATRRQPTAKPQPE